MMVSESRVSSCIGSQHHIADPSTLEGRRTMNAQAIPRLVVVVWCLLLLPALAWAQATTGTIAGVVKDTSGAVIPRVTLEAATPALIRKSRTGVSDTPGAY